MSVTIKDIAKAAGVSHTTVSRALRHNPAISSETTARIQDLAKAMGYVPNSVAQNLLSRETKTIGVVVTTIADPFMAQVVEGIEKIAQEAGYSIFLSMSHNDPAQELAVVETLQRRRADAIIVTSSQVGSLYSVRLNEIQVPIVLINNQEEGQYLYSVAVDDEQGAQLAVMHLLTLGHHRVAYLGAFDRPKSNRRRLDGYKVALEDNDIVFDSDLVLTLPPADPFTVDAPIIDQLLRANVTAVFCYNDMMAIELMAVARARGLNLPQDLSIVGFDDLAFASYVTPPLTTVHQPRQQLGELAMAMTLDLLDEKVTENQRLACELVIRQSTAAAPAAARRNV